MHRRRLGQGFIQRGGAPWDSPPPQKTEDNNIINLILNWLDMQQYKQWRIFLFSSLLTCCRYVATPGLASSARNIVHCLKPNCLGTRPRSSIPLCVRTYYVCERNLSKEEAHGGPAWQAWDLQSSYIWNLQCKARRCHESPS